MARQKEPPAALSATFTARPEIDQFDVQCGTVRITLLERLRAHGRFYVTSEGPWKGRGFISLDALLKALSGEIPQAYSRPRGENVTSEGPSTDTSEMAR